MDVCNNIDDYNAKRNRKALIVFDMIADIVTNKRFQAIIKKLFIRCKKLKSLSLVCSKRSQTEFNTLLDNENSQQKRITTNCY